MPERGTTGALFILRRLQEEYHAKAKKFYMCSVYLEKTFDRVPSVGIGNEEERNTRRLG